MWFLKLKHFILLARASALKAASQPLEEKMAIVTAPSVGKLQSIHHRQPYLLLESEIQQWITGAESGMPSSSKSIKFHRVSKSVNDPNNNESENIEPV